MAKIAEAISAHTNWSVRPVREGDEQGWRELYAGYRAFYGIEQTDETASLVWSWLLDPDSMVEGIADDNYRARGKDDKRASRTPWITYDMQP